MGGNRPNRLQIEVVPSEVGRVLASYFSCCPWSGLVQGRSHLRLFVESSWSA